MYQLIAVYKPYLDTDSNKLPEEKKQKDKTKIFNSIYGTVVNLTTDCSFDFELCGKILMTLHMWLIFSLFF